MFFVQKKKKKRIAVIPLFLNRVHHKQKSVSRKMMDLRPRTKTPHVLPGQVGLVGVNQGEKIRKRGYVKQLKKVMPDKRKP